LPISNAATDNVSVRKLRWPIGILIVVVLVGAIIALRKPADPLASLAPYIAARKTIYYSDRQAQTILGTPGAHAMEYRYVALMGIDESTLSNTLNSYIARQPGWSKPYTVNGLFDFESFRGPVGSASVRAIQGSFFKNTSAIDRSEHRYMIELGQPLSTWDLLILRISNIGRDPFDHSHDATFP
jgi:hypothetical protein